jgi:zinc protease
VRATRGRFSAGTPAKRPIMQPTVSGRVRTQCMLKRVAQSGTAILAVIAGLSSAAAGAAVLSPPTGDDPPIMKLAPAPMQAAVVARPGDHDLPGCRANWNDQIVSMSGYRRTAVVSAWLRNGVRVHHLRRDSMPGLVFVTVSFSGGEMLETAENRGVTLGACSAMDALSVENLPAACVPSALEGRDVHIEAIAGPDAMQLRVWGRREDIEEGMRVAAALFAHAKVTPATLAVTINDGLRQIENRAASPGGMVADAIGDAMFPAGEVRGRPPTAAQLEAVTVEAAQAWLNRHFAEAPVEVAVVGDLTLDEGLRLAAGYVSGLPERPRACKRAAAELRRLPPPRFPIRAEVTRPVEPGFSVVVVGFPGADGSRITELRTLRVAARVLDARATQAMRAAGFADVDVGTAAIPGNVYPGYGVVVANARVPAARAEEAAAVLESVVRNLAAEGVSEAEIAGPRDELVRAVERFEREPRYWESILARSESTGVDPDQVAEGVLFYRSVTANAVSSALRDRVGDDRLLRLIINSDGTTPVKTPSK